MLIGLVIYFFLGKDTEHALKQHGIRTTGIIIYNKESASKSMYRLGGNINHPTIKFITETGEEVVGQPISGFISQYEVLVPSQVKIIYDKRVPKRFCIDAN